MRRDIAACARMLTGSMGCGGSRSATIEPRYYESRDTESTWLTSTDTETHGNGTGENDGTAAAGSGQREEKPKEKKLVNAGTQCGRNTGSTQRRPAHGDEVKCKSKKTPQTDGVKSVRPTVNTKVSVEEPLLSHEGLSF